MKITTNRDVLLPALQILSNVIERRQTLPILANFLFTLDGDRATLVATDLEVEVLVQFELSSEVRGSTTLPERKVLDICRALPENAVLDIRVEGEHATLRSGKSRFTLATLPAQEFPTIGEFESLTSLQLDAESFLGLLRSTEFAMAQQDVRFYLNGLLLDVSEMSMKAVATDGHRLALSQISIQASIESPLQVIVPRKGVQQISRMLSGYSGQVQLNIGANHISVSRDGLRVISKLIEGKYPDYERVIPKGSNKLVKANCAALLQGLTRVSVLSSDRFKGVRLALEVDSNLLRAFAHSPENEEAEEEIPVQYRGESLEIGFNVSYLTDVINAVETEELQLEFSDSASSCLIESDPPNGSMYVIMPMRL